MRHSLRAVAVGVAVALAGCGNGDAIRANEVGTACPAASHGEGETPLADFLFAGPSLVTAPAWTRVTDEEQLERGTVTPDDAIPVQDVRLVGAEHLAGPPAPEKVRLTVRALDEAAGELGRGSAVVLVSPTVALTTVVASVRRDGSVAFLGECAAARFAPAYDAFVKARNEAGDPRSAADLLYALPRDPALGAAFGKRPEEPRKTWADRTPEQRVIDPDGAAPPPATVMADLRTHLVHFRFPAEWKAFDASIATFVPGVGWNAALPLRLESADPAVPAYVSLTKPLEVWLLPSPGDISRPYARLAVVDAALLATKDDVYLEARVEAGSRDELVARAKAGEPVFAPA